MKCSAGWGGRRFVCLHALRRDAGYSDLCEALGGGFPISAMLTTAEIASAFILVLTVPPTAVILWPVQ